jgi:hypothetical protein
LTSPDGRQLKPLADRADGEKVTITMEIYTEVPLVAKRGPAPQARPADGRFA